MCAYSCTKRRIIVCAYYVQVSVVWLRLERPDLCGTGGRLGLVSNCRKVAPGTKAPLVTFGSPCTEGTKTLSQLHDFLAGDSNPQPKQRHAPCVNHYGTSAQDMVDLRSHPLLEGIYHLPWVSSGCGCCSLQNWWCRRQCAHSHNMRRFL